MTRRLSQSNQQNAAKSTGPKSPLGKAATARNAIKHGLSGRPALSDIEKVRFDHLRTAISAVAGLSKRREDDIRECAISQVLLERIIDLRHRKHMDGKSAIHELEKLTRFENSLTRRRNRLLHILNMDAWAPAESEA